MFLIFYHILVSCVVLAMVPLFPFLSRKRIRERLGLDLTGPPRFRETIWVHALSVGEVISALPLIDAIREKYQARHLFFSATTNQGMALAKKELWGKVGGLIPMPMDFWWSVHRIVHHIGPAVFVLVETDIWPGLLSFLGKRGVKCILVNGRISPKTYAFYNRIPFVARKMFEPFDRCLMQTDLDRDRLLSIGVDKEKVETSGNIKFDRPWSPMDDRERSQWMERLGIGPEHILFVAGSTHPGEEEILMRVCKRVRKKFGMLRMVIAPRRIERAGEILKLACNAGFRVTLETQMKDHPVDYDVFILDTMGELGRLYGLAQISFVGGSMVPFGGHNLLEPASFGCPVLFGPYTENFMQMSDELVRARGGWRIQDEHALEEAIIRLLGDPRLCTNMGRSAQKFVFKNRGALARVMAEINHLLVEKRGDIGWE